MRMNTRPLPKRRAPLKTIKITAPGGYTTVQDLGRYGFARFGVPVSGALDRFSARLANLLVGNTESCALLELTVMGPSMEIRADVDIAVTGAVMPVTLNRQPVPRWASVRARAGDILSIGMVTAGCRGYLAFGGGIDVPEAMGSFSTYVGGGLGGFQGRPLKTDDVLAIKPAALLDSPREVPAANIPDYPSQATVRVVPGPQGDSFDMADSPLFKAPYMVTAKADRMGYRLQGEAITIREDRPKSIVSEPAAPGSIQIPPDRQPIILLAEQTVGGYAKIATVISTDLPRVAQTTPGDSIAFTRIDIEEAHRIYRTRKREIETLFQLLVK